MTWNRYLWFVAALLIASLIGTTCRDLSDGKDDSLLGYMLRILVLVPIAWGLIRRNLWAVRIIYLFSIFTQIIFLAGLFWLEFSIASWQMIKMIVCLIPLACCILIPRDILQPTRKRFKSIGRTRDPDNPYSPPSAEVTE